MYVALVHKEPDSSFGVEFPDFPGCVTAADTFEELYKNAQEVLSFHVRGMLDDGETIPEPRPLDAIMHDPEFREHVQRTRSRSPSSTSFMNNGYFLVQLTGLRGKAVRINITVEENLLAEIDAEASARHTTRSGFLADAAREALNARVSRRYPSRP